METTTKLTRIATDTEVYTNGSTLPQSPGEPTEPFQIFDIREDDEGRFVVAARVDTEIPAEPPEQLSPEDRSIAMQIREDYMAMQARIDPNTVIIRTLIPEADSRFRYFDEMTTLEEYEKMFVEEPSNGQEVEQK